MSLNIYPDYLLLDDVYLVTNVYMNCLLTYLSVCQQ